MNTIHSLFIQNVVYVFINETYTHSSVYKTMHEAIIKCVCLQADTLFFLLMRSDIQNIYKLISK